MKKVWGYVLSALFILVVVAVAMRVPALRKLTTGATA